MVRLSPRGARRGGRGDGARRLVDLLCDQLNNYKSEPLVRLVAAHEDRDEHLGVKGASGILHTLAAREACRAAS